LSAEAHIFLLLLRLFGAFVIAILAMIFLRIAWDMLLHGPERIREYQRWRYEHRNDINGMYVDKEGKIVLVKRFDDKVNEVRNPD